MGHDRPRGTYQIENNVLTATSNRTYTYVFEVVDENVLRFVQDASSDVSEIDEQFVIPVLDGAEFELSRSQPVKETWDKQPESKISITTSDRKPNYATIIHKWDGNVYKYDETDVLMWSGMSSFGPGPVYVSEDLRKTIPITFENGKASFVFSKADLDGWANDKKVGYRLLCRWGDNECEFGFVVYIKE